MIGVSHISVVAFRGGGGSAPNPDFISTWDTTQAGSASDTVVLPLLSGGTYSGTIDWGDGNTSPLSYGNRSHTYAVAGTYTITISGSDIQGFQFNNGGDKAKITNVSNWGNLTLTTNSVFYGCSNLDITATDAPTLSTTSIQNFFFNCSALTTPDLSAWNVGSVTDMRGCFYGCVNFNGDVTTWNVASVTFFGNLFLSEGMFVICRAFNQDISGWNVSAGINFGNMFYDCDVFNQPIGNWTTSSATNMYGLIRLCAAFDQSVGGLDITTVSDLRDFATGITISTANYDDTLIQWEAQLQAAYPGGVGYPYTIATNFGSSQYTLGSAADTARASLIANFGWTITDGGPV